MKKKSLSVTLCPSCLKEGEVTLLASDEYGQHHKKKHKGQPIIDYEVFKQDTFPGSEIFQKEVKGKSPIEVIDFLLNKCYPSAKETRWLKKTKNKLEAKNEP